MCLCFCFSRVYIAVAVAWFRPSASPTTLSTVKSRHWKYHLMFSGGDIAFDANVEFLNLPNRETLARREKKKGKNEKAKKRKFSFLQLNATTFLFFSRFSSLAAAAHLCAPPCRYPSRRRSPLVDFIQIISRPPARAPTLTQHMLFPGKDATGRILQL